tara:strand:- start:82 stop:885 length:804 start_codon:yes stop_codon:yes gene_type:complete
MLNAVTFANEYSLISITSIKKFNQKMNKLLMVYGCVLISSTAIANDQQNATVVQTKSETPSSLENSYTALHINAEWSESTLDMARYEGYAMYELNLNEIEYIEEEPEFDLGFDTADYLPSDFNPYETYFDLNSIIYVENEVEPELGFDTQKYLPADFNAYTDVVDVHSINYIEVEDFDLGFNTKDYLPEGFSPYEVYVDLNAIPYVEDDVELELGINSKYLLPANFDPYTNVIAIGSINYMEDDEIELGFDTGKYLPENFDPYIGTN